jgi:hypothetical protein
MSQQRAAGDDLPGDELEQRRRPARGQSRGEAGTNEGGDSSRQRPRGVVNPCVATPGSADRTVKVWDVVADRRRLLCAIRRLSTASPSIRTVHSW